MDRTAQELRPSGGRKFLGQIRELLQEMRKYEIEGDFSKASELQKKAEELAENEFMSVPLSLTDYQPCADLYFYFPHGLEVDG